MESLVTLALAGNKCIKEQIWKIRKLTAIFQRIRGEGESPTLSRGRRTPLDLPLDIGECHGNFGDASAYRDRMYKEQTDKHSSLYI
jgi:hypothetical protein